MKKYIFILLVIYKTSYSQTDYLLLQKNNCVYLYDFKMNKDQQLLHEGNLEGYSLNQDSLIIYTSNNQKEKYFKWTFPINILKEYNFSFADTPITNNFKVILDNDGLKCYKNGEIIWEKVYYCKNFLGLPYTNSVYSDLSISPLGNKIICTVSPSFWCNKKNTIEIELINGNEKTIAKHAVEPSYSNSGKYILYKSQENDRRGFNNYMIYDCVLGKNINNLSYWGTFYKTFWIKKQ